VQNGADFCRQSVPYFKEENNLASSSRGRILTLLSCYSSLHVCCSRSVNNGLRMLNEKNFCETYFNLLLDGNVILRNEDKFKHFSYLFREFS
jgi:hypothetical protein